MCQRSSMMRAAAGAMVFPGGTLGDEDEQLAQRVDTPTTEALTRRLNSPLAVAYAVAGCREMTEEVGLGPVELLTHRGAVIRRETTWSDVVASTGVLWPVHSLVYLAHWITPAERLHRFDTRFFVVEVSDSAESPDGDEIVDTCWTTPSRALRSVEEGQWTMLTPTLRVLTWLAQRHDTSDALASARHREVTPIQPRVVHRDGVDIVEVPEPGL